MARPRMFAPPVAFRLPPEFNEKLEDRALRSGKPLAVYVREEMIDLLTEKDEEDRKQAINEKRRRTRARNKALAAAAPRNGD